MAAGIKRVSISLDGASARTHDANRGSGSFMQAMNGIDNLRGKIDFQINTTITRKNKDYIQSMFDLAEKIGRESPSLLLLGPYRQRKRG